jgi:single-stranded-DNA-specific exonuclease
MDAANKKRWLTAAPIPGDVDAALAEYPPIFRQVLYNRGVMDGDSAQAYLRGEIQHDDPFQLLGMGVAVERLLWAVDHQERVIVYGDYDVDGVSATALMVETLRSFGAKVRPYIPNRFDEGYGLNNDALDILAAEGVDLIVTVDCGIRSPVEAQHARELGIDLIVSDHHSPGSELPLAVAVICPKQNGDGYPDKDLAGVGLAYKIAQGLFAARPQAQRQAEDWLDLAALGTISDIVPLRGENRMLVRRGLEALRKSRRQGVVSLAGAAGVRLANLSASDVGFMLGPRLNAAGRLDSAEAALNLLLEEDVIQAGKLAQKLDAQNRERQDLTRQMQEQARLMAAEAGVEEIIFAFSPEFNPGVVGLAAARLVDTYYRPAIVGQIEEEFTRASCRSIPEFHITRALDACKDLLVRHGGHAVAAGFTVRNEDRDALVARLAELAREQLGGQELTPTLRVDVEVPPRELRPELLGYLDMLQPTGQENPDPLFVSRNLRVAYARTVGSEGQHLKMRLTDGWMTWDAIAFRQGHWMDEMPQRIDVAYHFERNVYNGQVNLQLNVRDIQASEG